ncbi:hypothetical protein DFH11DRAFT_1177388 [Phellopilus nigrolimitatus]|nr:hypothetical protein DFH11DRAFT_1177388 [Phellopilus nigrolimitatus]
MVNKLLDVPKDILLNVLYVCRVKDILAIEQTCSLLHDIVATRHLWLVQLHSLEQACAPDLPSYIDIEGLSYSDLRVLVVTAVRGYETCKKGLLISPETKRHTVMVETPLNSVNLSEHDDTFTAQLSPGGNYMILENRSRRYLQAFDVRSSRCVWTYPEAGSDNSSRNSMINVALEACTSTSLLVHAASMDFVSGTLTLEIFRFDYSERHETRVRKIAFFQSQSSRHRLSALHNVCLGGDFVVAFTSSNLIRAVIVWNWCSEQMMEVTFGRNIGIKDLKIMRDHLFYVLYNLNGGYILGSISLRRLEGLATSSVDLADVNTCSLELNPPAGFELGGISPVALCGLFKSDRMSAIRAAVILSVLSEGRR